MANQKVLFIKPVVAIGSNGMIASGPSYAPGEVRTIDSTLATDLINAKSAVAWDATTFSNPNLPPYLFINTSNQDK